MVLEVKQFRECSGKCLNAIFFTILFVDTEFKHYGFNLVLFCGADEIRALVFFPEWFLTVEIWIIYQFNICKAEGYLSPLKGGCHHIQQSMVITHFQLGRRERAIHKVNCKRTSFTAFIPAVKTRQPFQFSCLIVQINGLFNSALPTCMLHKNILWNKQTESCYVFTIDWIKERETKDNKKGEIHEVKFKMLLFFRFSYLHGYRRHIFFQRVKTEI